MVRFDDWPKRLSEYLTQQTYQPFEWGKHDCLRFAAGCVHALTGRDFAKEYEDYHDEAGIKALLDNHGGVEGIITKHLGAPHFDKRLANRGDIVIMKIPEMVAGVVDDSGYRVALVTPQGLQRWPLKLAWHIWSY